MLARKQHAFMTSRRLFRTPLAAPPRFANRNRTMSKLLPKSLVLAALAALAVAFAPSAFAQLVSSRMTGLVRDTDGKAVAGATVTAVHTPTNTTYTSTTNATGRYVFSGLPVGGPFTVTTDAAGYKSEPITGITTQLGETVDVNVTAASDVLQLEKMVTRGSANDLNASATGASSNIGGSALAGIATVQRSFADVARTTPFVSLRGVLASRQQPVISAVGQNNRFNSIQVDGARINDQFGLNGSGLQAFGNPISLDTIEQFNIAVSPYDVTQSGFTGASINAVTKSGTNEFHGSAYYYYTDQDLQGSNVFGTTKGTRALLEQKTKGFTLGGPIWKNHLFFFLNYEKYDAIVPEIAAFDPTASAQGNADLAAINTRLGQIKSAVSYGNGLDFGTFLGATSTINSFNEIKLAKVDWIITPGQRLSVRYNQTEGELPASGRYTVTNLSANSTAVGITTAPAGTNLSSNRFVQVRSEEVWAAQLFSQWSPAFKTELRYAQNEYSQTTPTNIIFPEIRIFGVSGVTATGVARSDGALVLGTEVNRQGNIIAVKTKSMAANGEYLFNRFTFSGGVDREQSDFVNLFRASSYGVFDYASVAAFLADAPSVFNRSYFQTGTPADEASDFAVNGLFSQVRWDVSSLFSITAGLRYDFFTSDAAVPLNTQFQQVFGFGNNGSVDGSHDVSPRLSFNYALAEDRSTQLRGGVGKFVGRIPWVMVSNSYGNSGVGRGGSPITGAGVPTLVSYLQTSFNPDKPIGELPSVTASRPQINLISDELKAPTVWRGNIAIDQKVPFLDGTVSLEAIHTRSAQALFIRDLNIKERFIGSDGRQVFAGAVSTAANALHPEFSNVYAVSNVQEGNSTYVALSLDRPMKNQWSYNVTYTRGSARDVLPLGETTAGSQFQRNPVFNQNQPVLARSAFEMKDRVQVQLAREFKFFRDWKTVVSLYYEGRTGNPYSFVYANDANGDGVTTNDLVYVPTGISDPVLAGVSPAVAQSIMDYVNGSELAAYKGKVPPRHAFRMPWVNRLDLHVSQTIAIYKPVELEVFADFINFGAWLSKDFFGYYETLPGSGDNELLAIKSFGSAAYTSAAQLQMTGTSFSAPAQIISPNNDLSRWRIQFGARLRF